MSEGNISLDTILNDEPLEAVEAQAAEPAADTPEPTDTGRDDKGRFAAKDTGVDDNAVPPTDKLPKEDYKAIREEREKRQTAERELESLKQQFQQLQQPATPPPSIWEDEQGWQQNFGGQVVSQAVQQASMNARLDMSEMMVRQANPDFEEVKAEFLALAEKNPTLAQDALADAHPWNKAYQIAKNYKTMAELGAVNVADLEAKIEARLRSEMQAAAPASPSLPTSLADAQSSRSASAAPGGGPLTLEQILGK